MTHAHRLAVSLVVLALTATACGSGERQATSTLRDRIQVSGAFREKPTIRIKTPLKVAQSSSWVADEGQGDRVEEDATVILQLTLANGRTGKTAISTLDQGQRPLEVPLGDQVFPSLAQALVGKADHARIVVASTPDDAYGDKGAPQLGIKSDDPVVMVADILSTDPTSVLKGPTGATRAAPATAPRVVEQDGRPVGFEFTGSRKPQKLTVVTLREGTGPEVETPDRVAVNYVVQVWGADKPVQETFSKEPTILSLGTSTGVIKAWDQALVGMKEGARVLILTPPALAYGASAQSGIPANSTLAFIVDVLGVG